MELWKCDKKSLPLRHQPKAIIMKRFFLFCATVWGTLPILAGGWPSAYSGVMLQGFSWNDYDNSQWTTLEKQAADFYGIFDLIWVPQSGSVLNGSQSMGYNPYYFFQQNSSFGTEAELRSMISTFKTNGIGTIADVVINHHNTNGWWTFPAENYNGETYQLKTTDIVADDDGGATATQAKTDGVSLSANKDEGEGQSGMRDLDHRSSNVQKIVKAYEQYLLDDLGYTGFRYDMVKGFYGSHIKDYNTAAGVTFSVGEDWSGNTDIANWIDSAGYTSAAFDFQFHYGMTNALNNNNWSLLSPSAYATLSNMDNGAYKQYAVTFIENHDLQTRDDNSNSGSADPISKDTLAANAYLLAMPGTPCVFFPHYKAYPTEIKNMILARKAAGITNTSEATTPRSGSTYYVGIVDEHLLYIVGSNQTKYKVDTVTWKNILSGYHYSYYLNKSLNAVWPDKPNGTYNGSIQVTLKAITSNGDARIVYTTDGTDPVADSPSVKDGGSISISANTVLKAALLINGTVGTIATRKYAISDFEPYTIKVYVNADDAGWDTSEGINFWTWGGDGTHAPANKTWPGDVVTNTAQVNGKTWFVKSFSINSADDYVNFVFSTGTGTPQSANVTNVNQTSYLEISSTTTTNSSGTACNEVEDVTATTGIEEIPATTSSKQQTWYTLQGIAVEKPTQPGIYIRGGKKYRISQ